MSATVSAAGAPGASSSPKRHKTDPDDATMAELEAAAAAAKPPQRHPKGLTLIFCISKDAAEHDAVIKAVRERNKKGDLLQDIEIWDRARVEAGDFTGAYRGHKSYLLDVPLHSVYDWERIILPDESEDHTEEEIEASCAAARVYERPAQIVIWNLDHTKDRAEPFKYLMGRNVWCQKREDESLVSFVLSSR